DRALGDAARVTRVRLVRDRIDHVAQDRERRRLEERIEDGRRRIGLHQHVRRVHRAPTGDRRAVGAETLLHALLQALDRVGQVLPLTEEVDELGVDHLDVVLLDVLFQIRWAHGPLVSSQIASSPVSPVRMRMTSSMGKMKILPSPILPVRAASVITVITCCTLSFGTMISTFTFGTKSTTYADPR